MKEFEKIKSLVASMEEDIAKFGTKGNNAAGTRLRKAAQEIKKACGDLRTAVQNKKNEGKD